MGECPGGGQGFLPSEAPRAEPLLSASIVELLVPGRSRYCRRQGTIPASGIVVTGGARFNFIPVTFT